MQHEIDELIALFRLVGTRPPPMRPGSHERLLTLRWVETMIRASEKQKQAKEGAK
jgi:hypothetical protein